MYTDVCLYSPQREPGEQNENGTSVVREDSQEEEEQAEKSQTHFAEKCQTAASHNRRPSPLKKRKRGKTMTRLTTIVERTDEDE